jgi:hypothetical protein
MAVLATEATAARSPTRAERVQLVRATRIYVDSSDCCAVISRIKILGVRVSTVDRRWAYVDIDGYDESGTEVGGATAVLHRGYLTGRWSVRSFGTSHLGCVMPVRVRRDLRISC